MRRETMLRLFWVIVFAVAFGFVESAVVVYLRTIYYPEGFVFPLRVTSLGHLVIEIARETATIVMLVAVAVLAGGRRWERFGYFLVAFGVWDLLYYVWLRVLIGWPASLTEWDVLFLIPLPWIGPVIAPVVVALFMLGAGVILVHRVTNNLRFHPSSAAWILAILGAATLIFSFVSDVEATLHGAHPEPYHYEYLGLGLLFGVVAFLLACGVVGTGYSLCGGDHNSTSPPDS